MASTKRPTIDLTSLLAGAAEAIGKRVAPLPNVPSRRTEQLRSRIADAKKSPGVCPYCAVGCGTMVYSKGNEILDIEGNPDSPINGGTLCPKGAATFQLHVNPNRLTKVLHRAPGGTEWEVWDLEKAMDRVAELTKKTRDDTFVERLPNGKLVNNSEAIFSLGGATMDNEWNHMQQKLLRGLGVVAIENQARI